MSTGGPRIFTKEYYDALHDIEGAHWWTLGMNDILDRVLISRIAASDRSVIDLGCGSGAGLVWARDRLDPVLLVGVDISSHAIAHSRNKSATLVVGSVAQVPFASECFDVAICNDILQHVDDDHAVVGDAFRILKPGGLLVIRTNGGFLLPRDPGSLRLYTKRQLRKLLSAGGFEVLILSAANAFGALFAVIKYYVHKLQRQACARERPVSVAGVPENAPGGGLRLRPGVKRGAGFAERWMRGTLRVEGMVMNKYPWLIPFGHSHIILARRPLASGAKQPRPSSGAMVTDKY